MSDRNLDHDSLAQALAWLSRHHGRERTVEALLADVPVDGALTPEQAVRALRDAGYESALLARRLDQVHALLLPAVLLLDEGEACILVARRRDGDVPVCDIVLPGAVAIERCLPEVELVARCRGELLVAHPRVAQGAHGDGLREPGAHWLWGTMRRFLPYYRSALLAALLSNALMLVTGIVTAVVYDKVIPHQAMTTLWALAAVGALAVLFDLTARQLRTHLIDLAGRKADLLVGSTLFRQSLGVRMESRPGSSGAYAHVLGQVETVREFFSSATLAAVTDLPFVLVFVAMTFVIGGPLGWVLVITIPLVLGLAMAIQGSLRRAMSANMRQHADLHGVLVEAVDGLEDLKAAGAQGRFLQHFETSNAAAAESALRSRRITSWTINLSAVSQQIVTLLMLVWGVHLIQEKAITGGMLIGAVMFAGRALGPLSMLVSLGMRYQGARAAMRALDDVMAQPVERDPARNYVPQPRIRGRLSLHDLGFAYPSPAGKAAPQVLQGLNLRFEPGERVAILGRIGSGKSTVLRLLAGLYLPTAGRVEVDGIDLRQIDPADYRAKVGFVAQDPRLFHGTLRDNVLLGRSSADPGRLDEIARLTGLARVVDAHPMGWDLPVGEAGTLLSGGQRQLVALTRCLVTRPQVILMDEPTSSMDAQSEAAFLRQLHAACGDCTLVMVTHRPAVLELVQRVLVVDLGRVVLDGPKAVVLAALSGQRPPPPGAAAVPSATTSPEAVA
ncbi:type I secretion system permease/ATPase [Ideonella sp. A 288]|uniref:type I secretion system permease/ATPase n=1 Tax=Ideonella sp. A 288 TaxID=1962181 RepID=UPI000B4AA455|nr:type I secretion system permease/ATPase [Ideonella sp. A 288]